jgi:IS1 family transposase
MFFRPRLYRKLRFYEPVIHGQAAASYHDAHVGNLHVRRLQCDEIWSFVGAKMKNASMERVGQGWGDVWTWTAIDADSKLIVSYMLGQRGAETANAFMQDIAARVANRIQLTTDGHRVYTDAVEGAFGAGAAGIRTTHERYNSPLERRKRFGGPTQQKY